MMREINWVGFRPSRRAPRENVSVTVRQAVPVHVPVAEVFELFRVAERLSLWLGQIEKLDYRNGGAITFSDEVKRLGSNERATGAFAAIDLPKRVVLVSDHLGQVSASFSLDRSGLLVETCTLEIAASVAPSLAAGQREVCELLLANFARVVERANGE